MCSLVKGIPLYETWTRVTDLINGLIYRVLSVALVVSISKSNIFIVLIQIKLILDSYMKSIKSLIFIYYWWLDDLESCS